MLPLTALLVVAGGASLTMVDFVSDFVLCCREKRHVTNALDFELRTLLSTVRRNHN
jgi:hypothetical protein